MGLATFWADFSQIHLVTLVCTCIAATQGCRDQGDQMARIFVHIFYILCDCLLLAVL
jgi:hypothetical protein